MAANNKSFEKIYIRPEQFNEAKFSVKLTKELVEKQKKTQGRTYYRVDTEYVYEKDDGETIKQPLVVLTDEIQLVSGGIPRKTNKDGIASKYYGTDNKRCLIFLPLPTDKSQPKVAPLHSMLSKVDSLMKINKKNILDGLGPKAESYQLIPLVRVPDPDDEKAKEYKNVQHDRIKVVLDTVYQQSTPGEDESKIVPIVKTLLSVRQPDGKAKVIETTDINEMEKYVSWNSTIRCLLLFQNMRVSVKKTARDRFEYELQIKCMRINVVKQSAELKSIKDVYVGNIFDDDVTDTKAITNDSKKSAKPEKKPVKEESEDESSDEEESPKKEEKKIDDDSNATDEESDEESEEEEKPKKPAKKPVKKPKKKEESDDEEDE